MPPEDQVQVLLQAMREIYEVWAGSEGILSETASEAYQDRLIQQMKSIAKDALEEEGDNDS